MLNLNHQNRNRAEIEKLKKAKVSASKKIGDESNEAGSDQQNKIIAAVINGVTNASRHLASQASLSQGHPTSTISFPQNGRVAISFTKRTSQNTQVTDDASTITFNHLGNPL